MGVKTVENITEIEDFEKKTFHLGCNMLYF